MDSLQNAELSHYVASIADHFDQSRLVAIPDMDAAGERIYDILLQGDEGMVIFDRRMRLRIEGAVPTVATVPFLCLGSYFIPKGSESPITLEGMAIEAGEYFSGGLDIRDASRLALTTGDDSNGFGIRAFRKFARSPYRYAEFETVSEGGIYYYP